MAPVRDGVSPLTGDKSMSGRGMLAARAVCVLDGGSPWRRRCPAAKRSQLMGEFLAIDDARFARLTCDPAARCRLLFLIDLRRRRILKETRVGRRPTQGHPPAPCSMTA